MGITAFRVVLLLASALAIFHAATPADAAVKTYGRELVASYELAPEQVALYRAQTEPGTVRAARSTGADPLQWIGPHGPAGVGRNPYKLVLTIRGVAPAAGDVRTHWQAGWEVQESPTTLRNVLMPLAALSSGSVNAGTPLTLTVVGAPVTFRGERQVAPMLNLVDARNFEIHGASLAVWSGTAPWVWPEMSAPRWALLLIGALCVGAWFALRRAPRPPRPAATSAMRSTTLSPPPTTQAPETDLEALLDDVGPTPAAPAMPAALAVAPPAQQPPVRANHAASVVAALRDVLSAGLAVPTVLDDTRIRKPRRG